MSHKTKYKIQRALGLELPGLGKPGHWTSATTHRASTARAVAAS